MKWGELQVTLHFARGPVGGDVLNTDLADFLIIQFVMFLIKKKNWSIRNRDSRKLDLFLIEHARTYSQIHWGWGEG